MALEEQHKEDTQKRRPGRPAKGDEAISREELLEAALKAFAERGSPSCSGLTRASIERFGALRRCMDPRVKPEGDDEGKEGRHRPSPQ